MNSQTNIFKEPVIVRIYLLLLTFIIALFLIWGVSFYYSRENSRFKQELANQQQKQQLGNLLQKKLFLISANFTAYLNVNHPKQIDNINTNIDEFIKATHKVVNALEKGGEILDTLQTNFYETDEFVERISYIPGNNSEFIVEVLNIRPKLKDLSILSADIKQDIAEKLLLSNPVKVEKTEQQISFKIKQAETILTRAHEHGNKIYFDVSNKLQQVEMLYNKKLRQWHFYEIITIIGISLVEIIIIIFLLAQTRRIILMQRKADEEKKKLVSSLNQSYETLKEIFDKIPVGVVLLKRKTIMQINSAAAEIMGYDSREEAIQILSGAQCHGCYCSVKVGECPIFDLDIGYFSLEEKIMIGKDGRNISILKSVIPVIIDDEEYLLEAFMDIEAQKKARDREAEANRAKSEFLANMSHEIRTPMNGIIGAIDILNNAELDEDQKSLLQIVQQSSKALLNIINDILDFSKIEAGKLGIDCYSFNIYEAVEAIVDQFALGARKSNLNLYHLIDKNIPKFVFGDEGRLAQILINLVGNAIKFTHKGHVFLRLTRLDNENAKKAKILFSIEDTGIGIPSNRIKKIFEAFTQADGSTIRKYGGTGLGTTISKMLVDLMGGTISAKSPNPNIKADTEGLGTVFHVIIEFEIDNIRISEDTDKECNLSEIDAFVITENNATRCIKGEILKNLGIPAKFFSQPDDALAHFKSISENSNRNQVLIIDYDDLEESAFGIIKKIKSNQSFHKLKVILTTTHPISQDKKDFEKNIVDAYFLKPIKQSKLKQAIAMLFAIAPSPQLTANDEEVKTTLPNLSILLAEDNIINQKIAKRSFASLNLEIDIVENGKKAIEAIHNKTYDFIFMDVMMPVMNGLDATKEIRKFNTSVKIIAMTANAMKGDREVCLNVGMNDYISKPFKMKDIESLIMRWV